MDEKRRMEKKVIRKLIWDAELGDEEAKKALHKELFRKEKNNKNNNRKIPIKITNKYDQEFIVDSIKEAVKFAKVSQATVFSNLKKGSRDYKGNLYEKVKPNEQI